MIDIKMPEVGEGVTEATIVQWNVKSGSSIKKGELLVEIMTDKVNIEVEAETSGVVTEIIADEEEEIRVGAVIARIQPTQGET